MQSPPPARAFTLIELLIVVAIIAILAAIAVPNFLEAQTRAKTARAKADERTIGTAMETYAVDYNKYPYFDAEEDHSYLVDVPMLTTPIAYLTSFPQDVFMSRHATGRREHYRYYAVSYWSILYPGLRWLGFKWIVVSNGPDLDIDLDEYSVQDALNGDLWMVYDPSNGTVSNGEIIYSNLGFADEMFH